MPECFCRASGGFSLTTRGNDPASAACSACWAEVRRGGLNDSIRELLLAPVRKTASRFAPGGQRARRTLSTDPATV
jgi:hypothetical protein